MTFLEKSNIFTYFLPFSFVFPKICIIFLTAYPGAEYKVITPANIEEIS